MVQPWRRTTLPASASDSTSEKDTINMKRKTIIALGIPLLFLTSVLAIGCSGFMGSKKDPGYQFVTAWGVKGSGPGEFNDPTGIAVTEHEVFVSDARNSRIQVFDLEGNFKRQFGGAGKEPGQLGRPMNLTIAHNELFVADYWNDRIAVFALDGSHKRTIGHSGSGPGEFDAPGGVAVAPNGDLFVADFYNQRIQHLRPDGTFIRQWGETRKVGIWAEKFNYPTDVALGPDGSLYVADGYNDRVQVFSRDGEFSHKWGGPFAMDISGSFQGWFAVVTSITVDPSGNVFAADFYNNRIQKFLPDGTFLTAFGEEGSAPGQFNHPIAVAMASDGAVFVVDYGNNRIQKWRARAE
jgi:sugar lactone lactonase YvrE